MRERGIKDILVLASVIIMDGSCHFLSWEECEEDKCNQELFFGRVKFEMLFREVQMRC